MTGCFAIGSDRILCSFNGAATLMAKHHDESHGQMIDRILDAPQALIVDHISCHSDHKQIAEPLIEYDLGRHARISAAENDRKRMLTLCQFFSFLARLTWVLLIAVRVASIAFFEPRDSFSGSNRRLVGVGWIAGIDNLVAAK